MLIDSSVKEPELEEEEVLLELAEVDVDEEELLDEDSDKDERLELDEENDDEDAMLHSTS